MSSQTKNNEIVVAHNREQHFVRLQQICKNKRKHKHKNTQKKRKEERYEIQIHIELDAAMRNVYLL